MYSLSTTPEDRVPAVALTLSLHLTAPYCTLLHPIQEQALQTKSSVSVLIHHGGNYEEPLCCMTGRLPSSIQERGLIRRKIRCFFERGKNSAASTPSLIGCDCLITSYDPWPINSLKTMLIAYHKTARKRILWHKHWKCNIIIHMLVRLSGMEITTRHHLTIPCLNEHYS